MITSIQPITTELVIQERVTSNEFVITDIHESISDRRVRVEVELGPFTETTRPNGRVERSGRGRRSFHVWEGDEYDSIRDTWSNTELIAAVKQKIENM